jgi:hypothetical protein
MIDDLMHLTWLACQMQSLLSTFAGLETVKGYDGGDLMGMQGDLTDGLEATSS